MLNIKWILINAKSRYIKNKIYFVLVEHNFLKSAGNVETPYGKSNVLNKKIKLLA